MDCRRIFKRQPTGSIVPRSKVMRAHGTTSAPCKFAGLEFLAIRVPRIAAYQSAAERGSGAASLQLGVIYAKGEDVPQDYAEAARWYAQAADQGVPEGHYNLAFLHLRGLGVRQDTPRALELLEQAAKEGSVQAAWALYDQFTASPYVVQNAKLAAKWLLRAADLGSAPATSLIAQMLDRGDPNAPTKERVVTLLARNASRGDAAAQANLALWYLEGKHGLHDVQLALRWFRRAAHGGNALCASLARRRLCHRPGGQGGSCRSQYVVRARRVAGSRRCDPGVDFDRRFLRVASGRDGSTIQTVVEGRRTGGCDCTTRRRRFLSTRSRASIAR